MRLCQYSSARYCNNGGRVTVTATTKVAAIDGNIVSLGCYTPTGSGGIYRGMFGSTGYHAGNGSICATGRAMLWVEIITGIIGLVAPNTLLVQRFGY